mgnify:CR=1 FL=1
MTQIYDFSLILSGQEVADIIELLLLLLHLSCSPSCIVFPFCVVEVNLSCVTDANRAQLLGCIAHGSQVRAGSLRPLV